MTIYIPMKAIILFVCILFGALFIGGIADLIELFEKIKGEKDACKEKKES